jgi:hypothetical protein
MSIQTNETVTSNGPMGLSSARSATARPSGIPSALSLPRKVPPVQSRHMIALDTLRRSPMFAARANAAKYEALASAQTDTGRGRPFARALLASLRAILWWRALL